VALRDAPNQARDGDHPGVGPDGAESTVPPATADAAPRHSRGRTILTDSLIGVATLLLILAMFSVWANRLLFNPDNWATTSTKLLQDPHIQNTTSNYLVDQLYANVNVAGLLRGALPSQLDALAAPAAGALRGVAVQGVQRALSNPRVQNLWAQANRAADQTFIAVANGGHGAVGTSGGVVTLNLGQVLDNVASRLGLPAGLSAKLPPNAATLTIFRAHQLKVIQNGAKAIKGLALVLTILVPLLYIGAILVARGRRRHTLMTVAWTMILAGVLVFLLRSILTTQIASSLTKDASLRPTITSTVAISTEILATIAGAVIFTGVLFAIAAWFAGPAHWAVAGRRAIAPYLHEHAIPTYGVTLALLLLLFIWDPIPATGTPAGIISFTVLGLLGTYLLRRETAREFPPGEPGAVGPGQQTSSEQLLHA
jgi:hypothetical protein